MRFKSRSANEAKIKVRVFVHIRLLRRTRYLRLQNRRAYRVACAVHRLFDSVRLAYGVFARGAFKIGRDNFACRSPWRLRRGFIRHVFISL